MQRVAPTRLPTGVMLVLLIAAAWEIAVRSGALQADAWPALSVVAAVFLNAAAAGGLWLEMGDSLFAALRGFAYGGAVGIAAGVVLGSSRPLFKLLEPTLELLRVIPLPALIPPALLAFGLGGGMKVMIVALAAFWPVLINTLHGVRGVEQTLVETARTLRVPPVRFALHVMLPTALPQLAVGLRIAITAALMTAVVTEMIVGGKGIGVYIVTMQQAARMPEVYAALILLSLVGYLLNRIVLGLEQRLMPWYAQSA